jgi:hypothetical protein
MITSDRSGAYSGLRSDRQRSRGYAYPRLFARKHAGGAAFTPQFAEVSFSWRYQTPAGDLQKLLVTVEFEAMR